MKIPNKLEIIIFSSGAIVMVLELIGSRILAPILGTSIFVWSSLIGIVMGALSLGYYLGGQFSKKSPNLNFLARILLIAGLTILLITIIKTPILNFTANLGVKFGSVTAALILFGPPSVILGMVSPYAVRLKVENVKDSGGVAGNLYALSTIGSIAGTFLAGFYLIPTFGSSQILYGLSFTLILISLIAGHKIIKIITLILVLVLWLIPKSTAAQIVFEGDSAYNHIKIIDVVDPKTNRPIRALYLATESHSIKYLDADEIFASYHKLYRLDNLFVPQINSALTLGGGAYVAPLDFLNRYSEAQMTVVEIDPELTKIASSYFDLKPNHRLNIIHQDARIFLNKNQKKFDVIYGDVFNSYVSIPFQLTSLEAISKISDSLNDNGVFILNLASSLSGQKSLFLQAEYKTLKRYFPQVYIFTTQNPNQAKPAEIQNIILIASKNNELITREKLIERANDNQKELLKYWFNQDILINQDIPILTDDFAPVDYYISKFL
ncbi:MAG: fused MFS/spermidine synthase [Patescibacteria group bacterium]|jgi:spermidine synthase|nr:fused MFS/spermidine synthase [Patescibacteria group bacterium]